MALTYDKIPIVRRGRTRRILLAPVTWWKWFRFFRADGMVLGPAVRESWKLTKLYSK